MSELKILGAWALGDLGEKRAIRIDEIKKALERGFDVHVVLSNGGEAIVGADGHIFVLPTKRDVDTIKKEVSKLISQI